MKFLPFLLLLVLVLLAFLILLGCSKQPALNQGVPNLHQVSPGLWRSAQPTTLDEWAAVKALGVHTVIKLNFDDEGSDADAEKLGMQVYRLGMEPAGDKDVIDNAVNTLKQPDRQTVLDAVSLMSLGNGVLVHCTHGQDRTGLAVGIYRLLHGWTREQAYDEMLQLGFHPILHGLHEFWGGFVPPPTWDH